MKSMRCFYQGLLVAAICSGSAMAQVQGPYEGLRWVRIEIESPRQMMAAMQLGEMLSCQPGPGEVDFAISADAMPALAELGAKYTIRSENLQSVVDAEERANDAARALRGDFFSVYRSYSEINSYLDSLDTLPGLPESQVTVFTVGQSIQNRAIRGIRISSPSEPGAVPKPILLITAMQHAREWAAGSSAMWIADRLVRLYGEDADVTNLVDEVDIRIIPCVNPDGYIHTFPTAQGGGGSRLWRKNRRLNSGGTFGVDLNRNWSVGWGGSGSSGSQTSDVYRGTAAFSEPETAAVRDYALSLSGVKGHIDLHTYSQLVLGPWGYTTNPPPRQSELTPLTNQMITAIEQVAGANWSGGPASTELYVASGTTPDWSFQTLSALAWTFELRDTGFYGFQLPASQIVPAAQEAYAGILVLGKHVQIRLRITVPQPPTSLLLQEEESFSVTVTTENSYSIVGGSPALRWRTAGASEFNSSPLTGGPQFFTASLPGFNCGRTVEYYIEAQANDGLIVRYPTTGVLTAQTPLCAGCYGDANNDQLINFVDVSTSLGAWGTSGSPGIPGDANEDGTVDFSDITAILEAWPVGCP